tara:strand:- start:941 stop:1465 length:525 start_codon:yes stop_codon:yes gene_type:complete
MKWWVLLLLPFQAFTQDIYNNCEDLVKTYYVQYDSEKEYYWEVNGGDIISQNQNIITIQWWQDVGEYKLLAWTTNYNCIGDTSEYNLSIVECPNSVYLPDAFTPDKDGMNEVYEIKGTSANKIKYMAIYDRWGGKIIEADTNILWDGNNCPSGVYSLVVLVNNKRYVKNIILIR